MIIIWNVNCREELFPIWDLFEQICLERILVVYHKLLNQVHYTLSSHIGKVVASHAAVARSIRAEVALIYNTQFNIIAVSLVD